jgi:putative transposase
LTTVDDEARVRADRARAVALWRYQLIREPADPAHSTRQRGRMVRELAAREHAGPFGQPVRVSRQSLDRWIIAWRRGGFDALVPSPRQLQPRTPAEILDMAAALKRENPGRTAAQVARILRRHLGWGPSESTVLRHLTRLELAGPPPAQATVFGRFEALRPNEIWVGDALHGPVITARKTYLFGFLDDHSRLLVGHRFGFAEDTVRLAAALRPALASRGVPLAVYVDNGSAFIDAWLLRACAKLGIKLIHSTPGRPQGRGKIERFFRRVRDQFLVELSTPDNDVLVPDLLSLNRLFTAWVETEYHRTTHSETGQTPLQRWSVGDPPALPTPAALREAFLWETTRTVTKTATVSLHGNTYLVDGGLVGRKVELVFDPFDLTTIEVRLRGKPMGLAIPHRIGRHAHPKAKPEQPERQPAPTSGIGYLKLIDAGHQAELADRVNYAALTDARPDTEPPRNAVGLDLGYESPY